MRISADDFMPRGLTVDDVKEVARRLDASGMLDYVTLIQDIVSHSFMTVIPAMAFPHGAFGYLAAGIKRWWRT